MRTIITTTQIKGTLLLTLVLTLVGIGFWTDGITDVGHHAMLIFAGYLLGILVGKLRD